MEAAGDGEAIARGDLMGEGEVKEKGIAGEEGGELSRLRRFDCLVGLLALDFPGVLSLSVLSSLFCKSLSLSFVCWIFVFTRDASGDGNDEVSVSDSASISMSWTDGRP